MRDFASFASRPNILIFLTDDWPYELWPTEMLGTNAAANNYTALFPAISTEFVRRGVQLSHAYTHELSFPSRRSLLSGRFMTTAGKPYGRVNSLTTRISTLADRLKASNYSTHFSAPPRLPTR